MSRHVRPLSAIKSIHIGGLSGGCSMAAVVGTYYRKHNPMISFTPMSGNATRCAKGVPASQLDVDLEGSVSCAAAPVRSMTCGHCFGK